MREERSQICQNQNEDQIQMVSQETWVVAMARRAGVQHAFLLIEGINENDELELYRADLFIDGAKPVFTVSGMPSSGTALIRLREIGASSLVDLANQGGWFAQAWPITTMQATNLLHNVRASVEEDIKYCLMGDGSIYKGSHSTGRVHNCVTWCKDRLRGIDIDVHDHWTEAFIVRPSDVVPGDDNPSKCSMM